MLRRTHLLFSFLCVILYDRYFEITNLVLFTGTVLFITLFVDIDESQSTFGKRIWPISAIIQFVFGHRGIFHSIFIPGLLFYVIYPFNTEIAVAIVLGYVSHLVMDGITKAGVRLFWPLPFTLRGPIKVGSVFENVFFALLLVVSFYLLW